MLIRRAVSRDAEAIARLAAAAASEEGTVSSLDADRIRANPAAAATTPSRYVTDWSAASANGPRPSCEGLKAACNAAELAAHDHLWNWKRAIAAALPGGAADVRASATAGGVLLMHLAWDEPAVLDPIAPDPDWQCPTGKACLEVSVAVPQP